MSLAMSPRLLSPRPSCPIMYLRVPSRPLPAPHVPFCPILVHFVPSCPPTCPIVSHHVPHCPILSPNLSQLVPFVPFRPSACPIVSRICPIVSRICPIVSQIVPFCLILFHYISKCPPLAPSLSPLVSFGPTSRPLLANGLSRNSWLGDDPANDDLRQCNLHILTL